MFQIKICGVTTAGDARLVADSGADAIGLNFVVGSPRRLTADAARAVAAAIPRDILRVGVFAGLPASDMLRMAETVGLDAIQLHGHLDPASTSAYDPPERCGELAGLRVIRAVRLDDPAVGGDPFATARRWIVAAQAAGAAPAAALVDAAAARGTEAGRLGGTGERVNWAAVAAAAPLGLPLVLAGGLTPANVAEAIAATGVRAVDTASGVESAPGVKDPETLRAFVTAARRALGR